MKITYDSEDDNIQIRKVGRINILKLKLRVFNFSFLHFPVTIILSTLLVTCTAPLLQKREDGGANTLGSGKVSGRSYFAANNKVRIVLNNPWIAKAKCNGELAQKNVCDVSAGSSASQTNSNADARAINSPVSNLIRQSAIDVIEGYLPQNIFLDVASQNLDNYRIVEALKFALKSGVHVRFAGNRDDNVFDYSGAAETESLNIDQFDPVTDYSGSDISFPDLAKVMDQYYPIIFNNSGTLIEYKRTLFPLKVDDTEYLYSGSYATYAALAPGDLNRFFFLGRTTAGASSPKATNLDGVSDFNLVNHTGQMHHKFLLIKTRKRDANGNPAISVNGNPIVQYHTITGSTNLTDNGYFRNNNNVIIFTEDREFTNTDIKDGNNNTISNGWPDVEEVTVLSNNNRCALDSQNSKPCMFNTYKRQMNYLLSDYDDKYKSASNGSLLNYQFDNKTNIDIHFSDYQSAPIIPRITDEALKAQDSIYFMVFSFSTATKPNVQGIKLHEALGPKHPLRGLIDIKGLMSPNRTENIATKSALSSDAIILEYDNKSQDPDFNLGANRLHHKILIIDPCYSNGTVVVGSANWSETVDGRKETTVTFDDPHAFSVGSTKVNNTKGTYNNEDIVIIRSQEIAQIFYEQEFKFLMAKSNEPSLASALSVCSN